MAKHTSLYCKICKFKDKEAYVWLQLNINIIKQSLTFKLDGASI